MIVDGSCVVELGRAGGRLLSGCSAEEANDECTEDKAEAGQVLRADGVGMGAAGVDGGCGWRRWWWWCIR
jgi:hypothetical protein